MKKKCLQKLLRPAVSQSAATIDDKIAAEQQLSSALSGFKVPFLNIF